MPDWKWAVIYTDGSEHFEEDDVGFETVDIGRVRVLVVFDQNNSTTQYATHMTEGMRPIFFRRRRNLTINDPTAVPVEYVNEQGVVTPLITFATVFGWQKTVNGKNVKSLMWIFHDGSVAITDRDLDELVI